MSEEMEFVFRAVFIGVGATIFMDLWAAFQKRVFGVPSLNYAMVGRWLGYFSAGKFSHNNIMQAPPIRHEVLIGWTAHYAIGVAFAVILLGIFGLTWARQPTPLPALVLGLLSVMAPFFIMQPALGAGIAAAKTPKPNIARMRSLIAHTSFGVGLYGASVCSALLF